MIAVDAVKAAALLFLAAVLEVSLVSYLEIGEAHPEIVLVLLVSLALLRGPVLGAFGGFWAGLVLDTASLGTLGLASLLLTIAGFWCGRFGDATTRSSANPVLVAILLATVGVGTGSALLHFMLGETLPVSDFVVGVLLPSLALNLLLSYPVYGLARRLFPLAAKERRAMELGAVG
jgi:rod shape-determining protein MreD